MKKIILPFVLLLFSITKGFSQTAYYRVQQETVKVIMYNDIQRSIPVKMQRYGNVSVGSAYFQDDWMRANVYVTDSSVVKNILVRLDMIKGDLEYRTDNGEEFICTIPVSYVDIVDSIYNKRYKFLQLSPGGKNKAWYQVLTPDTKITLLKEFNKEIFEAPLYNSVQSGKEIRTTERFAVLTNKGPVRIKKFKEMTMLMSGDNAESVEKLVREKDLNAKNEADLVAVVEYHNTLK